MGFLASLWMPIVLSAIIVFVASSIMHMLLPYHRNDYRKLPDEEKVLGFLRGVGLTRGLYVFPFGTHKDMNTPEMKEKYKQGPVGMMTVLESAPPAMPKFLGLWFLYCLIIGVFVAYLAWHTLAAGTNYIVVFRVVGTAAFLAYGVGQLSNGIWKSQPWSMTIKEALDGLVYALLTTGTFGWLWPK